MANNQRDSDFKRECIVAAFNNQVEYLRFLGNIDLRIFTGYITLQLILAGWLSKLASAAIGAKFGFVLIDLSLSVVAAFLLIMNDKRRSAALATFNNIIAAMGLCDSGEYLADRQLFAGRRAPSSLPWYLASIYHFDNRGLTCVVHGQRRAMRSPNNITGANSFCGRSSAFAKFVEGLDQYNFFGGKVQ